MEKGDRRVARTILWNGKVVSTVFLGLDHNYDEEGPPLLFETMVFPETNSGHDLDMLRYVTKEQAERGHQLLCNRHKSFWYGVDRWVSRVIEYFTHIFRG